MARIHFRPSAAEDAFPEDEAPPAALPDHLHAPGPTDRDLSARAAVAALKAIRSAPDPLAAFASAAPAARIRIARSAEGWTWLARLLETAGAGAPPARPPATKAEHDVEASGIRASERGVPPHPADPRDCGILWAERALQAQVAHWPEAAEPWSRYGAFLARTGQPRKRAALRAAAGTVGSIAAAPANGDRSPDPADAPLTAERGGRARPGAGRGAPEPSSPGPPSPGPHERGRAPLQTLAGTGRGTHRRHAEPGGGGPASRSRITVIVPVYGDPGSLASCLAALADTAGRQPWRALLVDDASPDPAVRALLDRYAQEPWIDLCRLPANRGYIGAVSEGLRRVPAGDVVLLNSDCVVPGGDWIDRLAAHAAPGTGTVTPFATDGQAFGFPRPFRPAPAFLGDRLRRIDRAARRANAGRSVRMLTSVGFCTYVTRACLDAAGGLQAPGLAAGYGEEVDFCLRASEAGFHHLAATDCFVTHLGAASFRAAKAVLVRRNEAVLHRRYPDYFARFAAQCAADPLRPARARIERALVAADSRKGGLLLVGRDAEALLATRTAWSALQQGDPLRLLEVDALAAPAPTARLTSPGLLYPQNLTYRLPEDRDRLAEDLAALGTPRVHVEAPLAGRVAAWFPETPLSLPPEDAPAAPRLAHELRAGLEDASYAGLFV